MAKDREEKETAAPRQQAPDRSEEVTVSSSDATVTTSQETIDECARNVHAWRVNRLARLGLAWPVAEAVADRVDWHEVTKLVRRGCPPALAVIILD